MTDTALAKPTPWRYRLFPQCAFPPFPSVVNRASSWRSMEGFVLRTETIVRLDWKDRLRILLTGWAVVKVQSITDVHVKKCSTAASFAVLPGDPRRFRVDAYGLAERPDPPMGKP